MSITATLFKTKYLTSVPGGLVDCGSLNANMYDVSESATSANFFDYFTTQYPLYYNGYTGLRGFDIADILTYIDANRGEEVPIVKFTNGADISVEKNSTGTITFYIHKGNITDTLFSISNLPNPASLSNLSGYYFSLVKMTSTSTNPYFGHDFVGIGIFYFHKPSSYDRVDVIINISNGRQENIYKCLSDLPTDLNDPYITNDNHTPSGGYGDFNYSGDDDLPPSLPTLSAAQVGFVSLWNPSQQEMKNLADYLWTGTFDLTNFKKLFTDPMECILSVGIVPVTPTTGTATEIVFGGSSHSGVNAKPVTSQFVTVDLGKVHINGQSASALDYSPYVKVSIFLPYCGTYALDADDVIDADVELEYHIDIYTGACVAYLTITKTNSDGSTLHSTLYQFTGNCLASIPITGNDHSQFIQSMLFMGAAVAATVATSGAGAPAIEGAAATGDVAGASAVNAVTASSAVNSVMSMKPNVLRSGNLSSTAGLLGKQRPCITVTWPNLCRPDTEYKLLGMPVHKSGTLSDFEGFTIVSAVHVENILCTEIEKQMIEQMLYKGVMV